MKVERKAFVVSIGPKACIVAVLPYMVLLRFEFAVAPVGVLVADRVTIAYESTTMALASMVKV